ncbi:MAG: hypothetical protein Q7R79_04740, partial [bacterium]|nr:hypothetical protein [bacterium]
MPGKLSSSVGSIPTPYYKKGNTIMASGSKTASVRQLALPAHYDPANAGKWEYRPNINALLGSAEQWAKSNGIKSSGAQRTNIHLLLIDVQKDFSFPEGTLYV